MEDRIKCAVDNSHLQFNIIIKCSHEIAYNKKINHVDYLKCLFDLHIVKKKKLKDKNTINKTSHTKNKIIITIR